MKINKVFIIFIVVALFIVAASQNVTRVSAVSGNIINLNFAISNSWPWLQTYGLDQRFDNGISNPLPASTACGGGSFASGTIDASLGIGIIFSGDSSVNFGQGAASSKNWLVGGFTYPEVFGSSIGKTSTQNIQTQAVKAGIPLQDLSSVSGCLSPSTSCALPSNLPKGTYVTTGDIYFNANPTNSFTAGNTYVFVAKGSSNIYFRSPLTQVSVPTGAIVFFAAGQDIIIDKTIGPASNACPASGVGGQLQGIFSADRNITIGGNNGDCSLPADKMLNVDGTLIVNAARAGGSLIRQRDLCAGNTSWPSLTVKARPDFVLNSPGFLSQQQNITHEEVP